MLDAVLSMLAGGNGILAIIGAAALAIIAAFFRGRVTGARAERDHQTRQAARVNRILREGR